MPYNIRSCISCGALIPDEPSLISKESNSERKFLAMILLLDLLVVGGLLFYALQPKVPQTTVTPSPSPQLEPSTQMQTSTPTSTPSPSPTIIPSPSIDDQAQVQDKIEAYIKALNRHSVDDVTSFFTDEIEILINHGQDYSYKGPKEGIRQYLAMAFMIAPDATITETNFKSVTIEGGKAQVQVSYLLSSKSNNLSRIVTEDIELVRQDNAWKIEKTDITY